MTKRIWAIIMTAGLLIVGLVVWVVSQKTTTPSEEPVVIVDHQQKKPLSISGQVVTAGGQVLGRATVVAFVPGDDKKRHTLKTDDQGQFSFEKLTPGVWHLDASIKDYVSAGPASVRALKVDMSRDSVQDVELVLRRPVTIEGRVVAGGKPVAGATLGLFYQSADAVGGPLEPFALDGVGTTDKNGRFTLTDAAPGRFHVLVEARGYDLVQSRELRARQGRKIKGLLIDLAPSASLVFDVVSTKGKPLIADVTVNSKGLSQARKLKTNAKGQVRFDQLPEGRYRVMARVRGFASEQMEVDATANTVGTHDIVMNPARGIFGRVIFPQNTGAHLRGAFVAVTNDDGKIVRRVYVKQTDGLFEIPNPPKSAANIQALSARLGPSKQKSVTLGQEMTLTLQAGGGISGKVVGPRGQPVASYSIAVESVLVDTPKVSGRFALPIQRINEPGGKFTMPALAPGTYVLRVKPSKDYAQTTSDKIIVRVGTTTANVVIAVEAGATIKGKVSDAKGAVSGAVVTLFDPLSRLGTKRTTTDEKGNYTLTSVQPGRQSLRVAKGGYLSQIVAGVEVPTAGDVTKNVLLERAKPGERFSFHGIGAMLAKTDKGVVIQSTMENMPAATYGLKAKDVIVSVDGEDTDSMPLSDVIKRIRGERGVGVAIEVEREGQGRLTIDVERGRVVVKSRGRPIRRPSSPNVKTEKTN